MSGRTLVGMSLACIILMLLSGVAAAQSPPAPAPSSQTPPAASAASAQTPPAASSPLFVVHFATGPKWDKSLPPPEQPTFKEHSANMKRLRDGGAIVFGARYADLGMIVLKIESLEAAKAVLDADPGVRSGIFTYEVAPLRVFYPWQG